MVEFSYHGILGLYLYHGKVYHGKNTARKTMVAKFYHSMGTMVSTMVNIQPQNTMVGQFYHGKGTMVLYHCKNTAPKYHAK